MKLKLILLLALTSIIGFSDEKKEKVEPRYKVKIVDTHDPSIMVLESEVFEDKKQYQLSYMTNGSHDIFKVIHDKKLDAEISWNSEKGLTVYVPSAKLEIKVYANGGFSSFKYHPIEYTYNKCWEKHNWTNYGEHACFSSKDEMWGKELKRTLSAQHPSMKKQVRDYNLFFKNYHESYRNVVSAHYLKRDGRIWPGVASHEIDMLMLDHIYKLNYFERDYYEDKDFK